MGVLRHRHHHHHDHDHRCRVLQILAALTTFLFLASAIPISLSFLGSAGPGLQGTVARRKEGSKAVFERFGPSRRALGLGSSPPTCRSKCGMCLPCRPVHVPIHPGLSTPLEYYPEAWRCQCRNKLFMP